LEAAMRTSFALLCAGLMSGCAAFPGSVREGVVEISDVTAAIECELAAVAADPDVDVRSRQVERWSSLTDLDLTLLRNFGADGSATVTGPAGLGIVSGTPKFGLTGIDTRTGHLQFATDIAEAKRKYGATCSGDDPSQTRMGLANWLIASLKAVNKSQLAGVTYTKQFEIVATAGARFGYTLVPVTNTVSADAGFGGIYDKTSRFSVALVPPPAPPGPPKPIPVFIVTPGSATPGSGGGRALTPDGRSLTTRPATTTPSISSNPELYYLLQRKSPVPLVR
jgi:hypothetical protein